MKLPRADSLFARLLLLQTGVALALLFVFAAVVYVDRNVAVARLVAERWAPALRHAAGLGGAAPAPDRTLLRAEARPPASWRPPRSLPRLAALAEELERHGVRFEDAVISRGAGAPTLWLQLRQGDGRSAWFGIADVALLPRRPGRVLLAVLISAAILVAVSWYFTRRLTRPLEQLRSRMVRHQPGQAQAPAAPIEGASPEVAAIEHAYDELLARYERHERERALLLAGVSHDLRSPLARIRMAAGLLPEDPASAPWREAIERNTDVADRLIGSFLDHVRAGELPLDQRADLAAIARSVAAEAGRGGVAPAVDAPPSLVLERCHPLLLERLMANLVDNACKHGRAPVALAVRAEGGGACIEVSDAGPGLPEAQREALTEAFARGDAARGTPGTGLGLAIVARISARLGGTLAFERRDGRHVARVTLPAAP
ncbi:MAG: ATP-binding protein [Piscinibacter sp.]|uniref:ATP-binding protein n=1 Tax=Piscinibacter sp. TaxID=1903157 RepID=UPI003D11361C